MKAGIAGAGMIVPTFLAAEKQIPELEAAAICGTVRSKDKAEKLAKENPDTTAFYRFADFLNYYPLRLKTDQYLYDNFFRLGGKPKEKHPLSFVLQGCDYLEHWFGNGMTYKIKLSEISSDSVSFSLGDSCAQYEKTGEIRQLTKEQLLAQIKDFNGNIENFVKNTAKPYSYIEAQLWDDIVILEHNLD